LIDFFNKILGTILYGSALYWILGFESNFIKFLKFSNLFIYIVIVTILVGMAGMGIGFFIGALFKTTR